MQRIGISDSTVPSESRWRILFWPTVSNQTDVDYIGRQGFWMCMIIAALGLAYGALHGVLLFALFEAVFFFLGGVGIRQRSFTAAVTIFLLYFGSSFLVGVSIIRVILGWLLLSAARGTWLCSRWPSEASDPVPPSSSETLADKFSDVLPKHIWPWGKWIFYGLAILESLFLLVA